MRCVGHVACMVDVRIRNKILVGKPEETPLVRLRHRWEQNIKTDFKSNKVGWCGLDSCDLDLGPMEACCEHHKRREISRLAEHLSNSEGLCSMELVCLRVA
jgi:hypothetical protein